MRYSTQPKFRKYVKRYGFLSIARTFWDKYDKNLMDTATKAGTDAAKTASKRVVQKIAEATGDLMGNKIVDKIISLGKNPDLRQQINFIGKLEDDQATMFFIIEKSEEATFEFLQNSVSII